MARPSRSTELAGGGKDKESSVDVGKVASYIRHSSEMGADLKTLDHFSRVHFDKSLFDFE